jgi:carboxymethylenebutenolidase
MIEQFVDIATDDGQMNTFIVSPEEDAPHPVVLFLMDAPGMREEIREMCRRLASAGYYVIASNLYYREEREFNLFEFGGTRERLGELMGGLNNTLIVADAGKMLEFADADSAADASRVGVVGYCMSGPFALMTAAAYPDQVKAAASMHGVKLTTDADDSPHRHLDAMNAEVYVGAAEFDEHISVDDVNV